MGDTVFVRNTPGRQRDNDLGEGKLIPCYLDPFTISKIWSPVNLLVQDPTCHKTQSVHFSLIRTLMLLIKGGGGGRVVVCEGEVELWV